eukprot:NODE_112_length_18534_cov_1.163656.p4 type:complete len:515 gc:universal NODE_112_length_18534_cov_1.163656:12723-11179(-)
MLLLLLSLFKSVSTQCMDVINLAKGLGMDKVQPQTYLQLQTDCCSAVGVTCDNSKQHVGTITWPALNLNGSINETAINRLIDLKFVHLSDNFIVGSMPTISIGLNVFSAYHNALNGSIALIPFVMTGLYLGSNHLTGNIPTNFPPSLTSLDIGYNLLSGGIPALPYLIDRLYIQSNMLIGTIGQFPSKLVAGFYYANLLTGLIPPFPSSLELLSIGQNMLEGVIPALPPSLYSLELNSNLFSKFENPIMNIRDLRAQGNLLSGEITITGNPQNVILFNNLLTGISIQNTSSLATCDISNNPMLGSASLSSLSKCTKNYLYFLAPKSTTALMSKFSSLSAAFSKTSTFGSTFTFYSQENDVQLTSTIKLEPVSLLDSSELQTFENSNSVEFDVIPSSVAYFEVLTDVESSAVLESLESSFDFSQMSEIETIPIFQESSLDTPLSTDSPSSDANTSSPVSIMNIVFLFIALVIICIILVVATKTMKNPIVKMKLNHVEATTLGGGKEGEITIMSMK